MTASPQDQERERRAAEEAVEGADFAGETPDVIACRVTLPFPDKRLGAYVPPPEERKAEDEDKLATVTLHFAPASVHNLLETEGVDCLIHGADGGPTLPPQVQQRLRGYYEGQHILHSGCTSLYALTAAKSAWPWTEEEAHGSLPVAKTSKKAMTGDDDEGTATSYAMTPLSAAAHLQLYNQYLVPGVTQGILGGGWEYVSAVQSPQGPLDGFPAHQNIRRALRLHWQALWSMKAAAAAGRSPDRIASRAGYAAQASHNWQESAIAGVGAGGVYIDGSGCVQLTQDPWGPPADDAAAGATGSGGAIVPRLPLTPVDGVRMKPHIAEPLANWFFPLAERMDEAAPPDLKNEYAYVFVSGVGNGLVKRLRKAGCRCLPTQPIGEAPLDVEGPRPGNHQIRGGLGRRGLGEGALDGAPASTAASMSKGNGVSFSIGTGTGEEGLTQGMDVGPIPGGRSLEHVPSSGTLLLNNGAARGLVGNWSNTCRWDEVQDAEEKCALSGVVGGILVQLRLRSDPAVEERRASRQLSRRGRRSNPAGSRASGPSSVAGSTARERGSTARMSRATRSSSGAKTRSSAGRGSGGKPEPDGAESDFGSDDESLVTSSDDSDYEPSVADSLPSTMTGREAIRRRRLQRAGGVLTGEACDFVGMEEDRELFRVRPQVGEPLMFVSSNPRVFHLAPRELYANLPDHTVELGPFCAWRSCLAPSSAATHWRHAVERKEGSTTAIRRLGALQGDVFCPTLPTGWTGPKPTKALTVAVDGAEEGQGSEEHLLCYSCASLKQGIEDNATGDAWTEVSRYLPRDWRKPGKLARAAAKGGMEGDGKQEKWWKTLAQRSAAPPVQFHHLASASWLLHELKTGKLRATLKVMQEWAPGRACCCAYKYTHSSFLLRL